MRARFNPYEQPKAAIGDPSAGPGFGRRFVLAGLSAFVLVLACAVSLQANGARIGNVGAAAAGVAAFAVPAGLVSALLVRRSEAALIVVAQLLTILGLFAWFSATA